MATTPASTALTASASQAARVRERTSAAVHAASDAVQKSAPLFPRALAMHQRINGTPAAVRCAMKFLFPNVPPGARFSAANSIFTPYAWASAVIAPITTTRASTRASPRANPSDAAARADQKITAPLTLTVSARYASQ